jgi:FMN phosphatase YigB (HAD superfamily)
MKLIIFDWGRTLYNPETEALFPETKEILEYLLEKKYILAVVALATAGQTKIDERLKIIEKENLTKYFRSIKFAVENKDKMYEDTLQELSVLPRDTVIVDDRVRRGIRWGNNKGCTTVWV